MKKQRKWTGPLLVNGALALVVIIWSIPTLGLLVSSFRTRSDIQSSGWWDILPHREWEMVSTVDPKQLGLDPDGVMEVEGVTGTFDELRAGVQSPDGDTRVTWIGNKSLGRIEVQKQIWTVTSDFTLDNYKQVLLGSGVQITNPDGSTETLPGQDMSQAFLNSLAVSIPSTVIPILIAAFAAYAFAWMNFPGRRLMFILVVGLLVVPLQIALVPILRDYKALNLNGTFLAIWLAHTGFGLALATYLLFNYVSTLPRETLESAFIDGASHFTIFFEADPAAVGPGPGILCHFPVPVGVERLPGRPDFSGDRPHLQSRHPTAGRPDGHVRQRLATADGRGVRDHDPAIGRVLLAATLLRARPAGRIGERLKVRRQTHCDESNNRNPVAKPGKIPKVFPCFAVVKAACQNRINSPSTPLSGSSGSWPLRWAGSWAT